MTEKYCLLHPGRCGSTVLAEMIESNTDVVWLHEALTLLIGHHRGNASYSFIEEDSTLRNLVDSGRFIEGLNHQLSKASLTESRVGFELKIHRNKESVLPQTNLMAGDSLDAMIKLGVTKFIFLRRDNLLRSLVSAARAFDSGVWHQREGETASPGVESGHPRDFFELPLKGLQYGPNQMSLLCSLEQMQADVEAMEQALTERNVPHLDLRYSIDVLPDPQLAFTKISKFLNLSSKPGQPTLKRTNPKSLRNFISNFKEVETELESTSFSWMLDDPQEEGLSVNGGGDVLCVTLCTHNPNAVILDRILKALSKQTLPKEQWHVRLVDNASSLSFDHVVQKYQSKIDIRVSREELPGILWARVCAFTDSVAAFYVILDDDTIPDEDYLEKVSQHFREHPRHGAIGGRNSGEFGVKPARWLKDLLPHLAVRDFGDAELFSDVDEWGHWEPVGAGMGVRREVVDEFLSFYTSGSFNNSINRTKSVLVGGEDSLLARCSYRVSLGCAYVPSLHLRHLIPRGRLKIRYLKRLFYGQGYSCYFADRILDSRVRVLTREQLKSSFWHLLKKDGRSGYVQWHFEQGYYEAIQGE